MLPEIFSLIAMITFMIIFDEVLVSASTEFSHLDAQKAPNGNRTPKNSKSSPSQIVSET